MARAPVALALLFSAAAALCAFNAPSGVRPAATPGPDVTIGPDPSTAVTALHDPTTIQATWQDVDSDDAGAVAYEWSINPGIQDWINIGMATSASASGLSLENGQWYTVSVRAVFGDGRRGVAGVSQGVLVDLHGPRPGRVADGADAALDIDIQASATTIQAAWTEFNDPEIGVETYEWAIGTAPGGTDIQDWTDAGAAASASRGDLGLVPGATYYVSVRGIDYGGLTGDPAGSDGVVVDNEGPAAGLVNDGSGDDIDTQASTSAIRANWSGFRDDGSGLASYEWAIGTAAGVGDIAAFESAGSAASAIRGGLALVGGTRYFVTVRAIDSVGNIGASASSDGVVVEATGPSGGIVKDGPGADIDLQATGSVIRANWSGFGAGAAGYQWAIGTTPGGTTIQSYIDVGSATSALRDGLSLADGTYYVSVFAYAAGGTPGPAVHSDGVTVDTTGPSIGTVNDGDGADLVFQNSLTTIRANWSGFGDAGYGIARYDYAIGLWPGDTSVLGWSDAGPATSMTRAGLTLSHGTRYHVSVRGIDAAGNVGAAGSSDGVLVDAVAPTGGAVFDGFTGGIDSDAQMRNDRVEGSWSGFSDPGMGASGIGGYSYSFGTAPGASDLGIGSVQPDSLRGLLAGLSLPDGTRVYLSVRAADAAGNISDAVISDGVAIDRSGPTGGVVNDGIGQDADLQETGDRIDANWSGFQDPGAGIASYQWAVGTTPGGQDLLAFTGVGPATFATLGGLLLVNGTDVYVSVRAKDALGQEGPTVVSDGLHIQAAHDPESAKLPGCGHHAGGSAGMAALALAAATVLRGGRGRGRRPAWRA